MTGHGRATRRWRRVVKFLNLTGVIAMGFLGGCSSTTLTPEPTLSVQRPRDLADGRATYVVRKGDTLYAIAFRAGHDYREVARWNDIKPPYTIYVGQVIQLRNKQQPPSQSPKSSRDRAEMAKSSTRKIPAISSNKKGVLKYTWQWPLNGKIVKHFSESGNKGIDLVGNEGQSVLAASDGKVVYSGQGLVGYGNLVIIKHSETYLSAYGNNKRLLVKEGDFVKGGQVIAEIGRITRKMPMLHFELRKDGKPVDPVGYLPKR